ncbi:MAG TPA: DUF2147 domain-containing protein [Alphaproteobacteria bacterium]
MRKLVWAAAGVLLCAGAAAPEAVAQGQNPVGQWMTEGGKSHVQIYQCGPHLCGRIVWLREPNGKDGLPKVDFRNPDQSKRSQKIVGLMMMWNFAKASDPGEWESGRIYNPEEGETYKSTLKLRPDGKLEVRGYVGISLLGKSQYWERVR